jgi:hypothetical protein
MGRRVGERRHARQARAPALGEMVSVQALTGVVVVTLVMSARAHALSAIWRESGPRKRFACV